MGQGISKLPARLASMYNNDNSRPPRGRRAASQKKRSSGVSRVQGSSLLASWRQSHEKTVYTAGRARTRSSTEKGKKKRLNEDDPFGAAEEKVDAWQEKWKWFPGLALGLASCCCSSSTLMVRADSTSSVTLGSNKRVGFEEKRIEEEKRRNYDGVKSGCCCVVTTASSKLFLSHQTSGAWNLFSGQCQASIQPLKTWKMMYSIADDAVWGNFGQLLPHSRFSKRATKNERFLK